MSFGGFGGGSAFGGGNNTNSAFGSGFGSTNNNNNPGGFGSNTNNATPGFGASNTSGSGLFGSGTTAFGSGSSNTGFGATNNSAFGAKPAFGGTSTSTGGGGLFGGTTPATSGTGFGGGFGTNNNTASTSSPFGGGTSTSLFGSTAASKPAFGAATPNTGGGLFGGNNTTANTTGGFGFGGASNASTSTALGGPIGDPPGTANVTNFQPFVEKESATSNAQNSFQNILFQDPYKKWSGEELRLADYTQGRRFGGTSGGAFGVSSGFGSFGNTTNNNAQPSNAFGTPNAATNTGGSMFGGGNPSFGQTNTTATSGGFGTGGGLFNQNKPAATTGTGLFGASTTTSQPAQGGGIFGSAGGSGFGTTNTTGGFGGANTNTGGSMFGNNNNNQNKPGFSFGPSSTNNNAGPGFGSTTPSFGTSNTNTGGGMFGTNTNNTAGQTTGGGMFGNNTQQNPGGAFGGGSGFGTQNQQSGPNLFTNTQQKPAGAGLFGTSTTGGTGGGFGSSTSTSNPFGQQQNTNQAGGGIFGNKPTTGTTSLFSPAGATQNTNTGGGIFGSLGQNNQNQQQQPQQAGGGMFGSLGQNQQKPSMFGSGTQPAGGGLFNNSQNNQQQGSIWGGSTMQQQQPQNTMGNSMFGNSQANQAMSQSLTASVNDPSAYGISLFGNLGNNEVVNPGPLATPVGRRQPKRASVLPIYKLNPASASRYATPQKRGYGLSYSTYGTPNSPSSVASTPGTMSQSLLGGSLTRSLSKSISTNSLRRNFNTEDSLLNPGAFSSSTGSRLYGNNVKKLVINRDLRPDLFSTPTKDKSSHDSPHGSSKLRKRVSFDTTNVETIENGDASNESNNNTPPSAEELGYIRPSRNGNGANGVTSNSPSIVEPEQVKGNELAVVHEEEITSPPATNSADGPVDTEPGDYWMSPSRDDIMEMNRVQRQKVVDFTVGRDNVGQVKFKVPVDLINIDLDNLTESIVILEPRTATVYPHAAKKPPVGKGLNVPAQITLENAWPRGTKNKGAPSVAKHIKRLQRIEGTQFESYNPETGEWTFSVEHFTTYGLDEDEDEDGVTIEPEASTDLLMAYAPKRDSHVSEPRQASPDDRPDSRPIYQPLPGAFDTEDSYESDGSQEMTETDGNKLSFLANRSAGSASKALVSVDKEESDDEYAMSEVNDSASTSLGQHLAVEQEDDSPDASQVDLVQETPAGIMRARMRAIKGAETPLKVQVTAGDDWADMLSKTISPAKRDRALLKSLHEADKYRLVDETIQDRSPAKRRVVSDSRGFATSIDLMNSLFEKAKMPAESLQSSTRPKGVKWPYKRTTKHLDDSQMDPQDRVWHDTMRPTWGPNGTLVFAANPSEAAFGRSGRVTERNGLMMVMKGGVVSESQDIRIAKFTNEMAAKAIDTHATLTQVELVDNVPRAKMIPGTSLRDFSVSASHKNSAEEHERLVWELASVLFDQIKIPTDMHNDPDALEKLRRDSLSRFWEHMVDEQTSKAVAMAGSNEEKALAALSGHRIPEACKHLLDGKDFRLATLVALIGTSDEVKRDMREQVKEWQEAGVLSEFSQPIRALYEMLSGNACVCEGTKGAIENRMDSFVISHRFGFNWQQALGLRLWYASSTESSIPDAVARYREDVEQDKELPPKPWFIENGIRGIWNDSNQDQRQDLLWGLLQLYSEEGVDLEAILRPENSQLSPLDYRLCWQLGQALTSTGRLSFGEGAVEKADAATISFAAQLTNEGSWLEATFVLLHLTNPTARSKAIEDHLCRHAGLIGGEDSNSFRKLAGDFKIPTQWIWHAKALFMRSVKKDPRAEVQSLLRANSYADAHRTFVKEVAPAAIIERDFDALADVLQQFEGRHFQVPDWNVGGEIYKAFLQLMGYVERRKQPPMALVNNLLEGLPAMHGNTPEAGIIEYAALTDMASEVAKVVASFAKAGQMEHERILHLPLTEDVLLRHSRDLAWSHYTSVMAGH